MNQTGVSVCYKILLIVACTLAGARVERLEARSDEESCHAPCSALQAAVRIYDVLVPFCISTICWWLMATAALVLRIRHKAYAMRALLWPIIFICVSLWIAYALFSIRQDRPLAYAWSLHASVTGLIAFTPSKSLVAQPFLYAASPLVCLACLCAYAREYGPPVGIAPWASGQQAQCGWMVHLIAVIGADLLAWVMSPLGRALWAI